jgi:hypothetical protein
LRSSAGCLRANGGAEAGELLPERSRNRVSRSVAQRVAQIHNFGCSGGSTITAFVTALDPRVSVAVTACYITSLKELFPAQGRRTRRRLRHASPRVASTSRIGSSWPRPGTAMMEIPEAGKRASHWHCYAAMVECVAIFIWAKRCPRKMAPRLIVSSNDPRARPTCRPLWVEGALVGWVEEPASVWAVRRAFPLTGLRLAPASSLAFSSTKRCASF